MIYKIDSKLKELLIKAKKNIRQRYMRGATIKINIRELLLIEKRYQAMKNKVNLLSEHKKHLIMATQPSSIASQKK